MLKFSVCEHWRREWDSIPPSFASHSETYSSAIIPCVCAAYKRIRSQDGGSIVSPVNPISVENGITGISGEGAITDTMSAIAILCQLLLGSVG